MEVTMGVVITAIIILIAGLVFATLIFGWSGEARFWMESVISPFQDSLSGDRVTDQTVKP